MQRFHLSLTGIVSRAAPLAAVALLLGCLAAGRTAGPAAGPRPGALVVVGGGALPDAIADRFLELAGGKDARIVVIPTAIEKSDCCHVRAIRARMVRSPASAYRCSSCGSREKLFTRRMAANVS